MADHQTQARIRKAGRLAETLALRGTTEAEAAAMTPTERQALARDAGVNPPSDTTWRYVVADLHVRWMLRDLHHPTEA